MTNNFASTASEATVPDPYQVPLECLDLSDPRLPNSGKQLDYYKRIREEDPVHYLQDSDFGSFWSITRHKDIQDIELNTEVFTSRWEDGGVIILDDMNLGFMSMDDPQHNQQRMAIMPVMSPTNLKSMEGSIRKRVVDLLSSLPEGEEFDWVEKVSVSLTMTMLAILLDFPFDEIDKLRLWTDWSADVNAGIDPELSIKRQEIMGDMATRFMAMFEERKTLPPKGDLISTLAHASSTAGMNAEDFLGTMVILTVGGNDTTRNSMTALTHVINEFPEQWENIKNDPSLIPNAVSELVRWQSPISHQRRNLTQDFEFRGKQLKKGDKVMLWYKAANRDEDAFQNANSFDPTRSNVKRHVAFGHGVHRCFGSRLGEMQVKILMEEMIRLGLEVKLESGPVRADTCLINGILEQRVSILR